VGYIEICGELGKWSEVFWWGFLAYRKRKVSEKVFVGAESFWWVWGFLAVGSFWEFLAVGSFWGFLGFLA